ncbi:MAG TPA: polysaccharide pyruvyl transferase CsaB [Trichormus sp.]|jgi:polysaccharide pyruvyl transferase CsaB
MTESLGNERRVSSGNRDLVLISGYYGFGNLGDEAILEEITDELKKLVPAEKIVVLSNTPVETAKTFGVRSISRWKTIEMIRLLAQARLFISGGGGLFQDVVSVRSPVFYGTQIGLARLCGAKAIIYAQGIGPLQSGAGKFFARQAFSMCDKVSVRDQKSLDILTQWRLKAELTADPVWCLEPKPLPKELDELLKRSNKQKKVEGLVVGLSLRVSGNFSKQNVSALVEAMAQALPESARIMPLVLQLGQDFEILEEFERQWQAKGREVVLVDTTAIERPSQWITLLSKLDLVVTMRLHGAIMALIAALPTAAIAYDPKVSHIARQFDLPTLNLTKEGEPEGGVANWVAALKSAVDNGPSMAKSAREKVEAARNLARQNFNILDRILDMQRDPIEPQ